MALDHRMDQMTMEVDGTTYDVKSMNWGVLPQNPTLNDLAKFSRIKLRRKRSRIKFAKNPEKYLPEYIYNEFVAKNCMANPIRRRIDYQAIGRKLLMVEELPQGAYARYMTDSEMQERTGGE